MPPELQSGFRLGPWVVEPPRGAISGPQGEVRHVEPKVMEVLVALAARPRQVVTRNELLDAVWRGSAAADELLTRAISELRRALDDKRAQPMYIETVPKRGYRLIGHVRSLAGPGELSGPGDARSVRPSRSRRLSTIRRSAVLAALALALGAGWLVYSHFPDDETTAEEPVPAEARRLTSGRWAAGKRMSIAVLPFVNMTGDPADEYFSDGLSEEIRNLLAKIADLKVTGRTSSFAFKGTNEDLRVVGRTLGVRTVLEGTVRRSGDRLRVTAELVDVVDGSRLWSDSWDRIMTDVFEVQEELAAAIIDELQVRIGAYPARGQPTELPEAYAAFLMARAALNVQDGRTAEAHLKEAVQLDPKFAEAWELLAHVYWTDSIRGIEPAEVRTLMREAAAKALAIDAGLPFARALHEEAKIDGYSLPAVLDAQTRAARMHPNDPAILRTLSWTLLITGYLRESAHIAERFVELDPLSAVAHIRHAAALNAVGRHREARIAFATSHRLMPHGLGWFMGEDQLADNHDEAAIRYFEAAARQEGYADTAWIRDLVTGGRDPASGQAHLDRLIPVVLRSPPAGANEVNRHALNRWYLFLGHLDRYFDVIFEQDPEDLAWTHVEYYLWWGTVYRRLGFTAHPRYLEVAERMRFTELWEQRGPPDFCSRSENGWVCT